ncbi:DUF6250 domain-containing protein [candidate division KSB1 bacterium]
MKYKTLFLISILTPFCAGIALPEVSERIFGSETLKLEEIFFDGFDKELSNWRAEGDARVDVREGFLEVDATGGVVGAATVWCVKKFSGAQVVEYDVRIMPGSLQSNINMFLLAAVPAEPGKIGTGNYKEYHVFPNYLVTILNALSPERRSMLRVRLRLNPGFKLAGERWHEPLEFGHVYHIAYIIRPPELAVYLDGRLVGSHSYETALNEGFHALRIWHTNSLYDNFRVSRVVE